MVGVVYDSSSASFPIVDLFMSFLELKISHAEVFMPQKLANSAN
jgi:hypothetical protein